MWTQSGESSSGSKLRIQKIEEIIGSLRFEVLSDRCNDSNILKELGIHLGYSLRILAPPLVKCLMCREELTVNNKATQIVVFTLDGPELLSKYILRCKSCQLCSKEEFKLENNHVRQDVNYHPDKYGNVKGGWSPYKNLDTSFVKASNEVYFKKDCLDLYISLLHHSWVSQ